MEIEDKLKILKSRDTKALVTKLHEYEDALEKALTDEAVFKSLNQGYLSSTGDCREVKRIMAELSVLAPETRADGDSTTAKKLTVADKEEWLVRQRKENKELSEAIDKQRQTAFVLEQQQINVEMARRRLEGIRSVIALKTQQIAFLASG